MALRQILCKRCNVGLRTRTGKPLEPSSVVAFRVAHLGPAHERVAIDFTSGLTEPDEPVKTKVP